MVVDVADSGDFDDGHVTQSKYSLPVPCHSMEINVHDGPLYITGLLGADAAGQ